MKQNLFQCLTGNFQRKCFYMHIAAHTYQLWLTVCDVSVCLMVKKTKLLRVDFNDKLCFWDWLNYKLLIYSRLSWIQCKARIKEEAMWSLFSSVHTFKHGKFIFCNPLLTVRIISVHFRYIYSTDFICGQGIVRFVNLPEKYSYSQSRPGWVDWLSRLR